MDAAIAPGICPHSLVPEPLQPQPGQVQAAVEAAVAAGFREASVWAWYLPEIPADSGLKPVVIEAAIEWATGDDAAAAAEADQLAATVDATGARNVLAVCFGDEMVDTTTARLRLQRLIERLRPAGATVVVEFLPWSPIPDLATCWDLIEPLGPDFGVLLDTWHWQRQPGGPNLDLLATIPGDRIFGFQLSDATPEPTGDSMTETMQARLLPGEGVIDYASIVALLDKSGAQPFISVEIFNPGLVPSLGIDAAAQAMWRSAHEVLGRS